MPIKSALQARSTILISSLRELRIASSLDGSVTFFYLIGLVFGLYELITHADWWLVPLFFALILTLFLLDYVEYQCGNKPPTSTALLLLCLRFLCITTAALLPPGYMTVLYLTLPFRVTLSFGSKAGYGMAAIIILIYSTFYWLYPRVNLREITTSDLYFWGICIWSVLKAQSILRERESQQREYQSRMRAEELLEEVQRSHYQLSIYMEQVAALATIEERYRIAREIHDSIGHSLTAIHLQLKKALAYYAAHPEEAYQSVQDACDAAREALQDMRQSVGNLRTEEQPFSCVEEITQLSTQLRQNGLSVHFIVTGNENSFSRQVLATLYRVAQECCTNIQRHAQARKVQITLDFGTQNACLQVSDDGIGFDLLQQEQISKDKQSYGIQGIQERLRLVNGDLHIESIPDQGTRLIVTIDHNRAKEKSTDNKGKQERTNETT